MAPLTLGDIVRIDNRMIARGAAMYRMITTDWRGSNTGGIHLDVATVAVRPGRAVLLVEEEAVVTRVKPDLTVTADITDAQVERWMRLPDTRILSPLTDTSTCSLVVGYVLQIDDAPVLQGPLRIDHPCRKPVPVGDNKSKADVTAPEDNSGAFWTGRGGEEADFDASFLSTREE